MNKYFDSKKCSVNEAVFTYYPGLHRVQCFVEENISTRITLEDAARQACLERTYFSSFFKHKTGICFKEWLASYRVNIAKKLIKKSNISLTRVSNEVGFNDTRTFQRTFKKYAGITPWQYKKINQPK